MAYKLTERRLRKCQAILEKNRESLYSKGQFDAYRFESEMREALGLGYQTFKDIVRDIYARIPRYKYVAAYYVYGHEGRMPVCEYHDLLSDLYSGLPELKTWEKQGEAYWERFKSPEAMELRREIDELRGSPDEWKRLDTLRVRLRGLTGEESR